VPSDGVTHAKEGVMVLQPEVSVTMHSDQIKLLRFHVGVQVEQEKARTSIATKIRHRVVVYAQKGKNLQVTWTETQ